MDSPFLRANLLTSNSIHTFGKKDNQCKYT